jgi:carboxypeptidase family protein/TonB-dependent receptor-like protein
MPRLNQKMLQFLTILLAALFLCGPAFSQYDTGSIAGTVLDEQGGVVAGATVKVTNTATGRVYEVTTDDEGRFVASALPAGIYRVEAGKAGFSTGVDEGVTLHANEVIRSNVRLKIGSVNQQVTVQAQTTTVNTETSDLGLTVESKRVSDLPLNGRDFTNLIALVPGSVISAPLFQTSLGGFDTSIIGTNVLLDGADATRIDTNSITTDLGRQQSRVTRASVDSIAEFTVIQGTYSAEYGRSVGNLINVITKSGTNELHGGVFEFFRNDALDARNFFAVPGSAAPLRLNQFGGNTGGPIVKDKLFFFVNYEGVRQDVTNSQQFHVLNNADRALFVASMAPVVAALPPANDADPLILANGQPSPDFDLFNANLRNTLREDTGSIKIDWNANSKNAVSFRYNINDSNTSTEYGPSEFQTAPDNARTQFTKLSWTYTISPTLLNQAGFAINKEDVNDFGGGGGFPLLSCFFCDFGDAPGPDLFSQISPQTSFQALDNLTKTIGRHTITSGIDFRWNRSDRELQQQASLSYGSITDFENNNGFALSTLGFPLTRVRNTNYDLFVQDDFRMTPYFTLNLGLRYEYNTVLHALDGRIQNFDIATQTLLPASQQLYAPDRNNFAPRFGFSWDPFHHGTTVVRGGFGIFYNPQLTGAVLSLAGNNVLNISENILGLLGFFGPPPVCTPPLTLSFPVQNPLPTCNPPAAYNVNEIDPHMRDSYAEHWNFGVQRQLMRNTVLNVDYVGNHGLKLPAGAGYAGLELNISDPITGERPLNNTAFADERLLGDFLKSRYDSLQVALRHHSGRLALDANYTWSHELDNAPNVFSGFQNNLNPDGDYSSGDIDVRHNFTADALYDLPAWQVLPRWAGSGWEVGTFINARSGLPVDIILPNNPNESTFVRPNLVPGVSIRPAGFSVPGNQFNPNAFAAAPAGTFGDLPRNFGRGPGFTQFDFSVIKNTQVNERLRIQFRAELFNIFNHPNFTNPDGDLLDATFGQSTSTIGSLVGIGAARQVQLALKLLF